MGACRSQSISKEILKCRVLPNPSSSCFSIQSTKVEADESRRLLIGFSDVVGLRRRYSHGREVDPKD